jgi:hypothetical protein
MSTQVSINHPTDRPNFTELTLGDLTVYFSYRTPIAFTTVRNGLVIRENDWSVTTGKHLNWLNPDKSLRVSGVQFMMALDDVTIPRGFSL